MIVLWLPWIVGALVVIALLVYMRHRQNLNHEREIGEIKDAKYVTTLRGIVSVVKREGRNKANG